MLADASLLNLLLYWPPLQVAVVAAHAPALLTLAVCVCLKGWLTRPERSAMCLMCAGYTASQIIVPRSTGIDTGDQAVLVGCVILVAALLWIAHKFDRPT